MHRPRRFERWDTSGFGCKEKRTPRAAGSEKRRVPSGERVRRPSRRTLPALPARREMRHSTISNVVPRTCRRYISSATAALILDAVWSPARAHGIGVHPHSDRPFPAPVRALRAMPGRFADDRDFVGLKIALLGAVLVLVAFLG